MKLSPRRRRLIGAIVLTIVATAGCDPITSLGFMMTLGGDPKVPPECVLVKDKKKEVKVVILASTALEVRQELIGADRELASLLTKKLQEGCKANQEKVTIVPASRVQRYKDEHPNWQALGATEIGKYFRADYVIDLEIGALTLYETQSANTLYRGNAEISVTVHDVRKDDEPIFHEEYTKEYPTAHPVPVTDSTLQKFRLQFLTRVATDLSWYFTAHEVADHVPVD